jgi:hypothetical protein
VGARECRLGRPRCSHPGPQSCRSDRLFRRTSDSGARRRSSARSTHDLAWCGATRYPPCHRRCSPRRPESGSSDPAQSRQWSKPAASVPSMSQTQTSPEFVLRR